MWLLYTSLVEPSESAPYHARLSNNVCLRSLGSCARDTRGLVSVWLHQKAPLSNMVHPILSMLYPPVASVHTPFSGSFLVYMDNLFLQVYLIPYNCPLGILFSLDHTCPQTWEYTLCLDPRSQFAQCPPGLREVLHKVYCELYVPFHGPQNHVFFL